MTSLDLIVRAIFWPFNRYEIRINPNRKYELLDEMNLILAENPRVAHETDDFGKTLLHIAAECLPLEFCKILIERNPEAVMLTDNMGALPFHRSCWACTSKHLFQLYPGCINVADKDGNYPIHYFLQWNPDCMFRSNILEITEFLQENDRRAVAKPNNNGNLPLHIAIEKYREIDDDYAVTEIGIEVVRLLFDAYPEAIYVENMEETPLQLARTMELDEVVSFFEEELECVRESEEEEGPDTNGQLLIHRGIYNMELSLGVIKLMIKANPEIVNAADNRGDTPLKIALNNGDNDIVKYLIKVDVDCLSRVDLRRNYLLHHACLAGNCDIINFILETSKHGASVRNSEGKLPIQLLMYDADCDRDSIECVSAIHCLLLTNPDVNDIAMW